MREPHVKQLNFDQKVKEMSVIVVKTKTLIVNSTEYSYDT